MVALRHRATLLFSYSSAIAAAIHGALLPESGASGEVPKTRGRVALSADGLAVELEAADLPSLRAAVNSYLRWVDAAEKGARLGAGPR